MKIKTKLMNILWRKIYTYFSNQDFDTKWCNENLNLSPNEKAKSLLASHYFVLFDSESDKGQEILVSLLAQKNALVTVDEILLNTKEKKYWEKVKKYLQKF